MAATTARASVPSAIADTMPTTMSSGNTADGIKVAPIGNPPPSLHCLFSALQSAHSGTADDNVAAAAVLNAPTCPSSAQFPPSKYSENIGEGVATLNQAKSSKSSIEKLPTQSKAPMEPPKSKKKSATVDDPIQSKKNRPSS